MRREARAMQNIKRICAELSLCHEDVLHKSSLVMKVYRDVVWMTTRRAYSVKEEAATYAHKQELDVALAYLTEFAPNERKQDFEAKVSSLFETKWMIDLINTAMSRVYEYPDNGKLYFEILSKSYMSNFKYSELDLLEILSLERSTFYDRKREATLLLGVALWGFAIPEVKLTFAKTESSLKS